MRNSEAASKAKCIDNTQNSAVLPWCKISYSKSNETKLNCVAIWFKASHLLIKQTKLNCFSDLKPN